MIGEQPKPTSRQRGGHAFVERKPNAWAGMIGFFAGRGYSSVAIAEALGDGTLPETIRAMVTRRWGVRPPLNRRAQVAEVAIPMRQQDRASIEKRASTHGITAEEYCRRLLLCASMPRDRYADIAGSVFKGAPHPDD